MINPETDIAPSKPKGAATNWQEILGYFAAVLMYFVWIIVFGALSNHRPGDEGGSIAVFLIILTQYFMSWVPRLREQPLMLKTVSLKWLIFPAAYVAIMAALMAGITGALGLVLDRIFD
jgi:hypothetical protein